MVGVSRAESGGRDSEPRGATVWCAGIPRVSGRPLKGEERARIALLRRRLLERGAAAILLFPLLACVFGFAAASAGPGDAAQAGLASVGILLTALCFPVEVLVARD